MRRAVVRVALACVGAVLLVTAGATPASAHAYLRSSTPAQGSVLKVSPPLLTLHFSEPVGTSLSAITVLDAAGRNAATGSPLQPFNVATDIAVQLRPALPDGSYLVVWRVVSDDSHPTAGSYSFSVGKAGAVASATASTPDPKVGAVLGFGRLLGFVGVAAFFGGIAFLLLCWPAGRSSKVSRRTLQVGWLLAFVGAVGSLLLEGPYGAGLSIAHTFDWSLASGVAKTRYGQALLARVVLLVAAAGAGWLVVRKSGRGSAAAFAVLALATLVTFPYTGHPSVGSQVPLAVVSDVAHLTAMSIWFGGLLHLSVVVLPDEDSATVRAVATRFSRAAMASVVVLVLSGAYQAWREAGIAASLTSTHYGKLLLVKTALVVAVLLVAEVSRRWVGTAALADEAPTARRLGMSVSIETAVVVVVLAVTSLLVSGIPSRTDFRPSSDVRLLAGPVHLELSVDPAATRVLNVRVDTTDVAGKPMDVAELTLTLQLPSPAAGPLNVKLAPIGTTQFQATDVELPYTGSWAFTLVARTSDTQEYTGRTSVVVR
ncbi:MAG: copper transport protein [Frankiales bacterium]|jgi:copper transport protein|nr:copper transport protein [Frankiales bacterium]